MLETVRQYAQEKLGESGEADDVRSRHRDYYTSIAALLDAPAGSDYEQRLEQADTEIDNLRAAFGWSRENSEIELALTLASSLQPLWQARGRGREGLTWFDAVLTREVAQDAKLAAAVRARALADTAIHYLLSGAADSVDRAQQALVLARDIDEPAVLARALTACGLTAGYNAEVAGVYFAEAIELARELHDRWRLSQILTWQANTAIAAADPIAARMAAEEGRDLADAIGDRFNSRHCRMCLGLAQIYQGDLAGAVAQLGEVAAEAKVSHDGFHAAANLAHQGTALALQGETDAARAAADASLESASEFGALVTSLAYFALGNAALAAGDVGTARDADRGGLGAREYRAGVCGAPAPRHCAGRTSRAGI